MTPNPLGSAGVHAQLAVKNLRVTRGGRIVLDGLDLTVGRASRIGLVGENGRGKSTLIAVLSGALQPQLGTVTTIGTVGVADQVIDATPGLSVGDLVERELAVAHRALADLDAASTRLGEPDTGPSDDAAFSLALERATALDAWGAQRRVDIALAALDAPTDRDRLVDTLSVGQRYRVRLAALLGAHHDFLLLDEPTNHLDLDGLDFLAATLSTTESGVVVASHDRVLLQQVVTDIVDLDPTLTSRPQRYGGGFEGYQTGRAAAMQRWRDEVERHGREHAQLRDDLSKAQNRLQSGWKPPKGTGKHSRATRAPGLVRATHRRLDDLEQHRIDAPPTPLVFRPPPGESLGSTAVIDAHEISKDRRLPQPVSMRIHSGDRAVLRGPNGAGKSTVFALLAGRLIPDSGTVTRAPTARVAEVRQESIADPSSTAAEFYRATMLTMVRHGSAAPHPPGLGSLGLLASADQQRPIGELSMGQRRRIDLAVAFACRPHVLLIDEPTNHLSMALVDELIEAFGQTPAAVVVATHDRWLNSALSDWDVVELE